MELNHLENHQKLGENSLWAGQAPKVWMSPIKC